MEVKATPIQRSTNNSDLYIRQEAHDLIIESTISNSFFLSERNLDRINISHLRLMSITNENFSLSDLIQFKCISGIFFRFSSEMIGNYLRRNSHQHLDVTMYSRNTESERNRCGQDLMRRDNFCRQRQIDNNNFNRKIKLAGYEIEWENNILNKAIGK